MTLGDGSPLEGPAEGTVKLDMILPDGGTQKCKLKNVLYVPKLSYSLLSVSKASEAGKTTKFDKCGCKIFNQEKKVIAVATKHGNLYYLEHCRKAQSVNTTEKSNEMLWHRRYGHVGEQNLKSLANSKLVERFDYDSSRHLGIKVKQDKESGSIWIGQPAYVENLLRRLGMQDSKPMSTPVEVNSKLQPATTQAEPVNQIEYQFAMGSLMYLAVSTRPDIAFAVNNLARFNSNLKRDIGQPRSKS